MLSAEEQTDRYPVFAAYAAYYGYDFDSFKVQTEDGYILTTFRITGKNGQTIERNPDYMPVMMMPGLSCDATSFINPNWNTE